MMTMRRVVISALGLVLVSTAVLTQPTEAAFTDTASATAAVTTDTWLAEAPTALAQSNSAVSFAWQPAGEYLQYQVQYSTSSSFAAVTAKTVAATELQVTGLAPTTTYYFRVRPTGKPNLPWSATASARTGPGGTYSAGSQIIAYPTVVDPHGLAIDSTNRIYVADFRQGSLLRATSTGTGLTTLNSEQMTRRSARQITLSNTSGSAVYVSHHNENGETARIADGIIQATSGAVTRRLSVDGSYGIVRANNGDIYFTQGNANGPSRLLRRCSSTFTNCTTVFTSDTWLGYLSAPANSTKIYVGGTGPVHRFDYATGKMEDLFNVGTDVRGIHAVSDDLFFFSDSSSGCVWRIDYNPTTRATNSRLILTLGAPRAITTTTGGDLIVATTDTTLDNRGVWRFAGLGK